jgi:hypothetical protein
MIGEHIRALKGGRWIHAIDCGDDTVLHLAEEPAPPRVRRAYRPEFVAGAAAVEAVTHRERTFPPLEVVRRAYSRASDPALATMFGDSASFADWCTSGRVRAARNVAVSVPGVATSRGEAPRRRPRGARAAKRGRPSKGRASRAGAARKPAPARKATGRGAGSRAARRRTRGRRRR